MASITERNGSYRIRVFINKGNKRKQKTLTWTPPTELSPKEKRLELDRIVNEFERTVNKGKYVHDLTFEEYSQDWIESYAKKELRPRTIERYESLLKKINQSIGHIKLLDIEQSNIKDFIDSIARIGSREDVKYRAKIDIKTLFRDRKLLIKDVVQKSGISDTTMYQITQGKNVLYKNAIAVCNTLDLDIFEVFEPCNTLKKPLAGKTLLHYYRLISLILKEATYDELIPFNPANNVRRPKAKRPKIKFLNEEEVDKFIKYISKEDILFRTIVMTYLFSGCRRAELLALTWDDVNIKKSTVQINKTLQYLPDRGLFIDETKTYESNRTISLPPFIISIIQDYKNWQENVQSYPDNKWDSRNFVFKNSYGNPIRPDRMTYIFSRFIKKTDLPDISLHSLRHTSATLQIMGGVPIRAVADRMGHVKTSTTLDFYSHALQSGNEYGAEVLGKMIDVSPFEK